MILQLLKEEARLPKPANKGNPPSRKASEGEGR